MLSFTKREKDYTRDEMLEDLRLAHKEWKDKESFFESVTDPDLIDYAIYDMEASKLKYIYLFKKVKEWDRDRGLGVLSHQGLDDEDIEDISYHS